MPLVKAKDLAEEFAVSERTIHGWVAEGMPTAIRRGAVVRFDPEAVREWLSTNQERKAS